MANNILDNIDRSKLGKLLQQARKRCSMTQAYGKFVSDFVRQCGGTFSGTVSSCLWAQ